MNSFFSCIIFIFVFLCPVVNAEMNIDKGNSSDIASFKPITGIHFSGNINLYITVSDKNDFLFEKINQDKDGVKLHYTDGDFYISGFSKKQFKFNLNLNNLNEISCSNKANIILKGIKNKENQLKLKASDNCSIILQSDNLNLNKITASEQSKVKAYWLNSDKIDVIQEDNSKVFLFGRARELKAKLKNYAKLYAAYLNTNFAYVTAESNANAQVWALKQTLVDSKGNSRIEYYYDSENVNGYNRSKSMLLRMYRLNSIAPQLINDNFDCSCTLNSENCREC